MKQLLPLMTVLSAFLMPCVVHAEEMVVAEAAFGAPARPSLSAFVSSNTTRPIPDYAAERNAAALRSWKRSLIPVAVSQTLDITSSYGMRELNPLLASRDGSFGGKATAIKLSTTAAMMGIEYLIVKKWPSSARVFSKLNWGHSVLTGAFAAHNYAIR
jgi:hypothetical protein